MSWLAYRRGLVVARRRWAAVARHKARRYLHFLVIKPPLTPRKFLLLVLLFCLLTTLLYHIIMGTMRLPPQKLPSYWADTDIRVDELYEAIDFKNLPSQHGWDLGFPIAYDRRRVVEEEPTLEVIVMPHSHNDPGHSTTFVERYFSSGNSILTSAYKYLGKTPDVSFEWAELAFLELWWRNHGAEERRAFRRVIESGQLELLTGGWVMTDEANAHYYGVIMQLLEGHEWVRNHLGPNISIASHWNIDTFGLSPVIPYLLVEAGLKQGVVMRVHYALRSYLAARRQMEFYWRQSWVGDSNATDFLMHIIPLDGFHVSESCGLDPAVCCQFDFERINKECLGKWGGKIVAIDESNVAERAAMLADQFRKKAQLYRGNVIFVLWGEDERYKSEEEWANQHDNLKRLFDHINSHRNDFNMHVRFGTARQYFDALRAQTTQLDDSHIHTSHYFGFAGQQRCETEDARAHHSHSSGRHCIPTLSGDFFTYAEEEDRYWTGYFTSRSFHKHMDRTLQHYLRTADILYTLAINSRHLSAVQWAEKEKGAEAERRELVKLYPQLVMARRELSLFQHHDHVAGTSFEAVMQDMAERLLRGIRICMSLITRTSTSLFQTANPRSVAPTNTAARQRATFIGNLSIDQEFPELGLPRQIVIQPGSELLLFNSLAFAREEVICILVPQDGGEGGDGRRSGVQQSRRTLVIYEQQDANNSSAAGGWIPLNRQQLQPEIVVIDWRLTIAEDKQKLCFHTHFPPLGFRRLYLDYSSSNGGGGWKPPSFQPQPVELYFKGEAADVGRAAKRGFAVKHISQWPETQKESNPPSFNLKHDSQYLLSFNNSRLAIGVDQQSGLMRQLTLLGIEQNPNQQSSSPNPPLKVSLSFEVYRSRDHPITSGAFIFIPAGPAKPVPNTKSNSYVLIKGPVRTELVVKMAGPYDLVHSVELDFGSDAPAICNIIDLTPTKEVELAMRVKSWADLNDFYTELNAYQFIRRPRRLDKLPIQAHVFPMPGAAFIEGGHHRLSLLGRQALSAASLAPGWMEILLDRHLTTTDVHPGIPIVDKRPTESRFHLLLEKFPNGGAGSGGHGAVTTAYHSIKSFRNSLRVHYPIVVQTRQSRRPTTILPSSTQRQLYGKSLLGQQKLPSDLHLVALRTLSEPTDYDSKAKAVLPHKNGSDDKLVEFSSLTTMPRRAAALILHRVGVECRLEDGETQLASLGSQCSTAEVEEKEERERSNEPDQPGGIPVHEFFNVTTGLLHPKRVAEASLTLLRVAGREEKGGNVEQLSLSPMEVKTWQVEF